MTRIGRRKRIIQTLDEVAFRLDTTRYLLDAPKTPYQPLPWVGIHDSRRAVGTKSRWKAIESAISDRGLEPASAIDVGCNVGYFSLSLVSDGWFVYGVDSEEQNLRIASHVAKKTDSSGTFIPIQTMVDRSNAEFLPGSTVTICLSIWHHWVRHLGADDARAILSSLWSKTKDSMFFDTGQEEMPDYYNLPFDGPAADWLEGYLGDVCDGAEVTRLGNFPAFTSKGHESGEGKAERMLFHVARKKA